MHRAPFGAFSTKESIKSLTSGKIVAPDREVFRHRAKLFSAKPENQTESTLPGNENRECFAVFNKMLLLRMGRVGACWSRQSSGSTIEKPLRPKHVASACETSFKSSCWVVCLMQPIVIETSGPDVFNAIGKWQKRLPQH